jgi:hypothetical protein
MPHRLRVQHLFFFLTGAMVYTPVGDDKKKKKKKKVPSTVHTGTSLFRTSTSLSDMGTSFKKKKKNTQTHSWKNQFFVVNL